MDPLSAFLVLTRILGGATAQPQQAPAPNNDAIMAAIIAALAQQRPAPQAAPTPLPKVVSVLAVGLLGSAVVAMFALMAVVALGPSLVPSGLVVGLSICLGALLTLTAAAVFFFFGSSLGSWSKNSWSPAAPAGGDDVPLPLPSPTEPTPQLPAPDDPVEPPRPAITGGVGGSTDPSTKDKRIDVAPDGRVASVRYKNPGAQYPSSAAAKFGQIGYGIIGGRHKIALFPHNVNGAASNFDLLSRNYTGMTIGEAGKKWTGANSFGVPGYSDGTILTAGTIANPATAIPFLKAIARREAGFESPLTEAEWQAAHAMFESGSADAWLSQASNRPDEQKPTGKQPTGADLLAVARPHIGEKYVFGARAPKNNASYKGPWDCAELVSWAIYQVAGIPYGWTDDDADPSVGDAYSGAFQRDAQSKGILVSVEKAAATPGAVLLRYPNGGVGHVVFSDGNGGTVEAASTKLGVIAGKVSGRRWDAGVLVPGVSYDGASVVAVSPPAKLYAVGQPNMRPEVVREIQQKLTAKGFAVAVDGEYGDETAHAVAELQQQAGIIADGEFGEMTAPLLDMVL